MITENPYIDNCESSTFSVLFNNFNWKTHIKFTHGILKYPEWRPNIDVMQYASNLEEIKTNPNVYFVFDASTEGFCPFKNFFFHNLYYSCSKHQINPEKIIFVSANMQDKENLKKYNQKNNIKHSIKVFCFLSFKKMMQDMVEDDYGLNMDTEKAFRKFKRQCEQYYAGIPGLSLSRINRKHRILANFLIWKNKLDLHFMISQNILDHQEQHVTKKNFNLGKDFNRWCKHLPKVVDTADFETNHALKLSPRLHSSTLFQIVNETHADNFNSTSLFYSEKTFRSIGHMQPFVIFGQQHCNKKLEEFGFRLFHTEFDYSFDSIYDTKERYKKILNTVTDLVKYLDSLTLQEQINWRFSQHQALKHNYELLMDINYFKTDFEKLIGEL